MNPKKLNGQLFFDRFATKRYLRAMGLSWIYVSDRGWVRGRGGVRGEVRGSVRLRGGG